MQFQIMRVRPCPDSFCWFLPFIGLLGSLCLSNAVLLSQDKTTPQPYIEQMIREYSADADCIEHRYRIPLDEQSRLIRHEVTLGWLEQLKLVPFDALDRTSKTDYVLFKNKLEYLLTKHKLEFERDRASANQFLPFSEGLVEFCRHREEGIDVKSDQQAEKLDRLAGQIEVLNSQHQQSESNSQEIKLQALRAARLIKSLGSSVSESDEYYRGYDPDYTWWCKKPMERLKKAIDDYGKCLQEKVVGISESDTETIIGFPIGQDGIALELKHEWIAHSPQELIQLAESEMAWCDEQIRQAAQEMGCGDDWRKALELVKGKHVQPGKQPEMIRNLANEAIQFLRENDLLSVPNLAATGWRMTMMSPERQRVSPYFLGGDTIIVSFPTDSMTHDEKLMSMRSNNQHFARATVHHELIPGHAMQAYMLPRHKPYRAVFETAFWIEGWALHWEMLLWDLGFARGPEDKVGMLFWRRHRCARIIFSLNYHQGKMTPVECVNYLVEQVGHERSAATAEVRRSVMGDYGPMYQAAYMLGGLQLRKLHQELVGSGKMSQREFHDAVLKEHCIPIEPLRNLLLGGELTSETAARWRFAE